MNNLLEHNQITLNQLENYISKDQDCCVVNPCGSGKTSVMSEFIRNHKDKKMIIFTKQINAGDYYRRTDPVFEDMDIFTYNHMLNDFKSGHTDGYDADFYILDEAHYIGADKWNTAFTYLVNRFSPTIIGFTATPQRFEDQGTDETIVTEFFSGNSAGNFSSRQLQKQGVFTEPDYILSLYDLSAEIEDRMDKIELSDLNENAKARYKKMLADTLDEWEKNSRPEVILRTKLPEFLYKENNNKILVYCSRIADIASKREVLDRMLKNTFGEKVISYRYTSKDSEKELEKFLSEDDSYIKVLYSVDKIMETIHIDDLNVMIMLRPSVSNRIITQQLGRVNSIGNKNKACIIDMVDNLSNIGSVSFLNKGTGAEHGGRRKADSAADINISIDMSHLTRYKNVFDTVDNVLVRFPLYHYKGFNGSLSQICNIYNRSYTEVKELMEKGFDIEDALSRARKSNPIITPAIFAGYTEPKDFSLTEEQKAETEKYIPAVERFVKNHKITDEDIIQELYMEMMYRVSKASESRYPRGFILNAINNRYAGLWRQKVIRESLYSEKNIDSIRIADGRNVEDEIFINSIKDDILPYLLKTLREREAYILNLRFGLDGGKPKTLEEVGKIIGTAKERTRQIESKALRKLRHPSRIGFICKGSEIDEVFRMYEDRNYTVEIADNAKNIAWKISG